MFSDVFIGIKGGGPRLEGLIPLMRHEHNKFVFPSVYYNCYYFTFSFLLFSFLALYGKPLPGDDHCYQIKVYKYILHKK